MDVHVHVNKNKMSNAYTKAFLELIDNDDDFTINQAQDHGMSDILSTHCPDYVQFIYKSCHDNIGSVGQFACFPQVRLLRHFVPYERIMINADIVQPCTDIRALAGYYFFDGSVNLTIDSYMQAYWGAQVAISCAKDMIQSGAKVCFGLVETVGHFAAQNITGGTCIFNHAAICVQHLSKITPACTRIGLLDISYNHPSGSQILFQTRTNPFFVSIRGENGYPFYTCKTVDKIWGVTSINTCSILAPDYCTIGNFLHTIEQALKELIDNSVEYLILSLDLTILSDHPYGRFALNAKDLELIAIKLADMVHEQDISIIILTEGIPENMDIVPKALLHFLSPFTRFH